MGTRGAMEPHPRAFQGSGGWMRRSVAILLIMLMGDTTVVWAQMRAVPVASAAAAASAAPDPAPAADDSSARAVRLLVGHSTVINLPTPIARVSLTSADVADALVTSQQQLLVHGKTPGTISMFVWERGGEIQRYEVVVQRDLARLNDQLRQLFPGEKMAAESSGKAVVVSGRASSKPVADRAVDVAAGYVDKKEDVVNLLQIGDVANGTQVLLRVRFAEVSRSALTQLGSTFFTGPGGFKGKGDLGQTATEQFPVPVYDPLDRGAMPPGDVPAKQTFSDFLNVFLFSNKYNVGTVITALQQRGLFQSLAEPNLIAENGKEASFLAGGEIPVPVVQGSGTVMAVTVQWKEFGIRLNFTPTVSGRSISLKVRPEVSTLDFNNAIILQGFRIPALSTRRTETEVQLADGQTFAIAGLINNQVSSTLRKMPGIGDIPILGLLFQSKAAQKDQTELVVMITPQILAPNSPGVTTDLPRQKEDYLAPLPAKKSIAPPPPAFGPIPQGAAAQPAVSAPAVKTAPASSAAAAAAAVSALTPQGPTRIEPTAAPATAAPANTATPAATRPLTADEQKVLERARRQEQEQQRVAKDEDTKRLAKEAYARHQMELRQLEQQQKLAKEQAKRDAERAKKAAEDKKKADEQQKKIEEAAAKMKAAEAEYQAELAKKSKGQQQQQ